jgi:uncharacterized phage-associated protein
MDQPNKRKLANTVLYLLRGCPTKPGLTHLLKMLYYADSGHYRKYLRSITGGRYVALARGPVLDDYQAQLDSLEQAGILSKKEVPVEGKPLPKLEYEPLREPNEAIFSDSELEILDEVIATCGRSTGAALSRRTHGDGPWSFAWNPLKPGRPMPYMLFRWLDNLPDEDERDQAKQIILQRGLDGYVAELNGTAGAGV